MKKRYLIGLAVITALVIATALFMPRVQGDTKGLKEWNLHIVNEFGETRDDEDITVNVGSGATIYADRAKTAKTNNTTTDDGTWKFYYDTDPVTITFADAAGSISKSVAAGTQRILLCDQSYLMTSAVTMSSTLSVEGNTTLGNATSDTITFTARVVDDGALTFGGDGDASVMYDETTDDTWEFASTKAIDIDSSLFDITISCNAAGKDLNLDSVLGSINIEAEENAANAILITVDGDTASTLEIFNDTGTSTTEKAASIQLLSDVGSIELYSGLDAADAINIMCDSSTAAGITIFNDTGTGDESIVLSSDVGGITVNAAAGSVDIEAVGGDAGDIGINAGDDLTITAAGDCTLAITGTLSAGGALLTNFGLTTEVVAGTSDTLTAAQSGSIIIYTQTTSATVTLCEATATEVGVWFILVDADPTAGVDLTIDPEGAGTINGAAAGNYIKCENDRDGEAVLIICTAADTWYTVAFGSSTVWTEE